MKSRINLVTLAGALLCLGSMLLSYIKISAIVISFPVSWVNVAGYANHLLYAVPVIGALLLLSGILDSRGFRLAAMGLGVIFCIYYICAYRNVLNGDLVTYLAEANLLTSAIGLDISDVQQAIVYLKPLIRLGTGAYVMFVGVFLSIVGLFVGNLPAKRASTQRRDAYSGQNNERQGGGYY